MPEDEFEIYLTLLAKTLRLSDAQRDAIAAELRDHMENRLRELTLQGIEREQAIQAALAEFGDASALAKDLTKTDPTRTHTRRHLMQTTFGTLIACAAVTFAVMLFTPSNKDGQPSQPGAIADPLGAIAQDDTSKETDAPSPDGAGREAGGGASVIGIASPASRAGIRSRETATLERSIRVIDCTEILRAQQDKANLYQRTDALADAVEQTVAAVTEHGSRAIQVHPFEQFIIVTATDSAHDQASKLLDQIKKHVLRRAEIQELRQQEQARREKTHIKEQMALEHKRRRTEVQINQLLNKEVGLDNLRTDLRRQLPHDDPQVKQVEKQIQELKAAIQSLEEDAAELEAQLEERARIGRH